MVSGEHLLSREVLYTSSTLTADGGEVSILQEEILRRRDDVRRLYVGLCGHVGVCRCAGVLRVLDGLSG
jgi:hypothetical protein